jgi:replicative DNA helicase
MNNDMLTNIPNNVDAEKALLGSIMLRPVSIFKVMDKISVESFYDLNNAEIYRTMKKLVIENKPVDLVTVTTELRSSGKLDSIGMYYLNDLVVNVPASFNISYYADIVIKNYTLRKLMDIGYSLVESGAKGNESTDTDTIISQHAGKLIEIDSGKRENSDIISSVEEFNETQESFKERLLSNEHSFIGIPCGFNKLDTIVDGLRPGHMWLIGGFTSSGKTAFLLNIINNIMATEKVSLFSLEMSRVDIVARLMALQTGMSAPKILRHEFEDQWQVDEFNAAKKRLLDSGLRIYSQTNMLDDIIMSMTRDIVNNKTKVFAIDYAQLVRTRSHNEYEQISETAQRLQNFARENSVTIIILSQISNEHAKDQNREVMGFKGGGTLPASADLAIELINVNNREERAERLHNNIPFEVNLIVRKNRHGRTGVIDSYFSPKTGKFSESFI